MGSSEWEGMMLSDAAQALWAKSPKKDTDPTEGHPVIAHLLDVAASAWAILELEPDSTQELFSADFQLPKIEAINWVLALIALHDLGKVSPAFQQLWVQGLDQLVRVEPRFDWRGINKAPRYPEYVSHSLISQAVLPKLLQAKGFHRRLANGTGGSGGVADAVGCHHGFRATSLEDAMSQPEKGVGIWDEARQAVFDTVLETIGVGQAPPVERLSAQAFIRLAGLTSFADWIGSSFYPDLKFSGFESDIDSYWNAAKKFAVQRIKDFGWTKREILVSENQSLEQVFDYIARSSGKPFKPRTLQIEIKKLVESISQPTLLLVEAAMGEGKTEAAFYAYLRLQTQNNHRGLYIALPTMATGNQMFKRTAEFLNAQAQGREVPVDLQLLHGATQLNDLYQQLQGKIQANTEDEENQLDNIMAREHFTHKKQALLSEYGVGTIDQALLTVLNIKWHFVRLWGLANRVIVIDEVHAYDTYTSELVLMLVRFLHELGSSVILMSATLPQATRKKLLEAYGGQDQATTHYPRLYRVTGQQTTLVKFQGEENRQVEIQLKAIPDSLDAIVKLLEEQLKEGGCAVCIVNTVDRAQELYGRLSHFNPYLFHARFPAEDRAAREKQVIELFGEKATRANGRRPERAVLIATQVVEQSLDLDFDLMVSDLAPADLLLQRAGRLWRHQRDITDRPIKQPTLYVAGLQHQNELPDLKTYFWDKVYAPYILYKTWELIKSRQIITLPSDIDGFVQQVYNGEPIQLELSQEALEQMASDQEQFEQDILINCKDGENALVSHMVNGVLQLREAINAREEDDTPNGKPIALTRKGETSVTVVPLYRVGQGFFLDAAATRKYNPKDSTATFLRSVRLSRASVVGSTNPRRFISSSLEKYNRQNGITEQFKLWKKDSLLRNCIPLILDHNGKLVLGKTEVKLDDELGIRYRKLE
jgi:CRISPR-associated endonuclease/helicase Cas3